MSWDAFVELGGHGSRHERSSTSHETARSSRPEGPRPADAGTLRRRIDELEDLLAEKSRLLGLRERQLKATHQAASVGQFTAGVVHDFSNVLLVILGYAQMILEDLPEESPYRHGIEAIRDAGVRGRSLSRQLLAISRRQTDRAEAVDLNQLVYDLDKVLRRLIGERAQLVTHLSPRPCPAHCPRSSLEQILMNLVLNAKDAMNGEGRLTIATELTELDAREGDAGATRTPGRYATMRVSDTGVGMKPEVLERAFEPFFTTKGHGSGTGLGLSTVAEFVSSAGGFVEIASEPGKGSTFEVFLPTPAPTES